MNDTYRKARRHLARRDGILKKVIAEIGPCTLQPEPDGFTMLVRSIVSQQISGKAANAIRMRLEASLEPDGLSAATILRRPMRKLRAVGLSEAKAKAIRDLAEKVEAGSVVLDGIHERDDEEVIAHLLPVRGIGRWTAEMFLMFSLGRLDVLPVNDYGLRVGAQRLYDLAEPALKSDLLRLAEPWKPYRSIATWYIWRSLGSVPQST